MAPASVGPAATRAMASGCASAACVSLGSECELEASARRLRPLGAVAAQQERRARHAPAAVTRSAVAAAGMAAVRTACREARRWRVCHWVRGCRNAARACGRPGSTELPPSVTEPGAREAVYCDSPVGVVTAPTFVCALTRESARVGARVVVYVCVYVVCVTARGASQAWWLRLRTGADSRRGVQARCNFHRGMRRARWRGASEPLRKPAAGARAVLGWRGLPAQAPAWARARDVRGDGVDRFVRVRGRWALCVAACGVGRARRKARHGLMAGEAGGGRACGAMTLRSLPARALALVGGGRWRCGAGCGGGTVGGASRCEARRSGAGRGFGARAHAAKGRLQCERAQWRHCEPEWLGEPRAQSQAREAAVGLRCRVAGGGVLCVV